MGFGLWSGLWDGGSGSVVSSFSGLQAWWDASVSSTITLVDTNRISAWNDRSGNNRTATQSVPSIRPIYQSNHGDGSPAIQQRDLNGEHLAFSPVANIPVGNFTMIALFKRNSGNGGIITQSNSINNVPYCIIYALSAGTMQLGARADSGTQVEFATANSVAAGNWCIVTVRRNSNTWGVRLDEGTEATTTLDIGVTTIDAGQIGNASLAGVSLLPLDGWYRELVIYNQYKSNTEQAAIRSYLRAKWPGI